MKGKKVLRAKLRSGVAIGSMMLMAASSSVAVAAPGVGGGNGFGDHGHFRRVLLVSIDGMHAVDFTNCANGIAGANGGAPYCPNIASLAKNGINFNSASTSKPSDSFPGLMAIVTGGSPRTVGVYYDVAYDRVLAPPAVTTGNGVQAGTCSTNTPNGTTTEYEEGIDIDQTQLNGGAPSGGGGVNSIDSSRLPRDPDNNCAPVFPWNFIRTNTIFGVIHQAHLYTAWSDKHPAYSAVSGPGNGPTNLDDFYSPEINSNAIPLPVTTPLGFNCNNLNVPAGDQYTDDFQAIQCYDTLKVNAVLNEINGKTHDGSSNAPVPNIFGMNFQAVSVGQKLIEGSVKGGYLDGQGTPSAELVTETQFVDTAIGEWVSALNKKGLLDSTLIVLTAKHGQSPIDPNLFFPIPGHSGTNGESPATILASMLPASESPTGGGIGPTEDDVSLLWLAPNQNVATAVAELETDKTEAGIGQIFFGPTLALNFNQPGLPSAGGDPRTPDIIVTPNVGVIYTGSAKKQEEHGGFAHDDTNVIMLLSNPSFKPATISAPVATAQVAPTILAWLGLNPSSLQAVQKEGTPVLPGIPLGNHD